MSLIINPSKTFEENIRISRMPRSMMKPKCVRDVFSITSIEKNGIFRLEDDSEDSLYDRCYEISEVNYINKDDTEKESVLEGLGRFLNSMHADFKITVANKYRDFQRFVNGIFKETHESDYPDFSDGVKKWMDEKSMEASIQNVEKAYYLTITVRTGSFEDALIYFSDMDTQLHQLFSVFGSDVRALDATERLDIIKQFFYHGLDDGEIDVKRRGDIVNDALPISLKSYSDYMLFNSDRYVSVLVMRRCGMTLNENDAIYQLMKTGYPSFVTVDYAPVSREAFNAKIRNANLNAERAISQEIDKKNRMGQTMIGISYDREKKRDELQNTMHDMDEDDMECFLMGVMVVVSAGSLEELIHRVDAMKAVGANYKIYLETYNQVQVKAFNTALPIGCRYVSHMRAFITRSAVALQPFHAQDLMEPGGLFYGVNRTTNHLVFLDRKKLQNPHGIIIGHSGSGKSFSIKSTEIAQVLLSTDDDIRVIDPQNELEKICKEHNGQFLDFRGRGGLHINPMEIPESLLNGNGPDLKVRQDRFVAAVKGWVFSFVSAAMINMAVTTEHKAFIGECLEKIYEGAFSERHLKRQPTLKDLREGLHELEKRKEAFRDKEMVHSIYNALYEFTEGSYDMFAHESNVDLDNRFVVFGINNIEHDLWEPVMITIMFFLTNRLEFNSSRNRATRLIVDEAQVVTSHKSSAQMLVNAAVTYRKYGGICTFAMQDFSAAIANEDLKNVFSNCELKLFFDQGGMDANGIAAVQELSSTEFKELSQSTPGYGVLVSGDKVLLLDATMGKGNPLYQSFSTNFHENASTTSEEARKGAEGKKEGRS